MKKCQSRKSLNTQREAVLHRKQMKAKRTDKQERGVRHAERQDEKTKARQEKKAARKNRFLAPFLQFIFGGKSVDKGV